MEVLDIVNKRGRVIGKATYDKIYKNLHTHRIVHILIFNKKGKLLLQLRSKNKSFCPLHWSTTVGGHVQSGETYRQAALRECQEELGKKIAIKFFFKDFYQDKIYHVGLKKFLVTFKSFDQGPFYKGVEEVEKLQFFTFQEINRMIKGGEKFHPELLFLLKKHFPAVIT